MLPLLFQFHSQQVLKWIQERTEKPNDFSTVYELTNSAPIFNESYSYL